MALAFTSVNEDARIAGIDLDSDILERLAAYMEDQGVQFAQKAGVVHRKSVFQILTRVLRLCPVDTGRLRGSWTTFMVARGFTGFEKFMQQPSILGSDRVTPKRGFNSEEVSIGQRQGSFVDAYLNTFINSNVVYASTVNERQGYLTNALMWGDTKYKTNMEKFLLASAQKEAMTDPIGNDDDGQAGT